MATFGVAGGESRQVCSETTEIFVAGVHSESIAKFVMDLSRFAMVIGYNCTTVARYELGCIFCRASATFSGHFCSTFLGATGLENSHKIIIFYIQSL